MTNETLVSKLIRSKVLNSPHIVEAFLNVDRGDFVLPQYMDAAYDDVALPLVGGATISQPTTVAFMMEQLQPQPKEKILDIGSGSAWTTAILSECVGEKGKVIGTEILFDVLKLGKENLSKYNYPQAELRSAGKKLGLEEEAPFDKILVSAAAEKLPQQLSSQLKIGGTMVVPVEHSILRIIRISEEEVEAHEYPGFSFVPLKG